MTTISFYARGDGSSANNASLNVDNLSQQPTVLITFNSGPSGDIILDANGGAVDPDTTVTINGTTYNFIVEQTGNLPTGHPKVPDVLEGKQVTVISAIVNGSYERFFFVSDGSGTFSLMQQFGNGAIALTGTNTNPPPIYICFCGGTGILTPEGYRNVEDLRAGDLVLNDAGTAVPIQWVGGSEASWDEMRRDPTRRPIRIAAGSIRAGVPTADLFVSAQHRVVLEDAWTDLFFGEAQVLVPAVHLIGTVAESVMPDGAVTYYHILLAEHEIVIANGMATESFQPSVRSYNGIAESMRLSLSCAFAADELQVYFGRPDAMLTLKKHEATVLAERMFAGRLGGVPVVEEIALAA